MKTRYARLIIILMIIASSFLYLESKAGSLKSTSEEGIVTGRWVLQMDRSSPQFNVYELEFVDPHTLITNISNNGQKSYNIKFQYNYIGDNRIKISSPRRLSSEWEVIYEGHDEQLVINSLSWPGGTGVFRRSVTVYWPSFALFLGYCVLGIFFIPVPKISREIGGLEIAEKNQNDLTRLQRRAILILITFVIFISGMIGGALLWSFPSLRQIRLPWDAVITIELSIILLILGLKTILTNRQVFIKPIISWTYFLGIFLIGSGFLGIVIGAGRMFLFIQTGFYL